jgi:hypothetical protein
LWVRRGVAGGGVVRRRWRPLNPETEKPIKMYGPEPETETRNGEAETNLPPARDLGRPTRPLVRPLVQVE